MVSPWTQILGTLSLCLVFFSTGTVLGQSVYYVSTADGLTSNSLTDLTVDSEGNMWIGSYYGLMKYSGTRIKSILTAGRGSRDLSSLEMHSIWEDKCGHLLVGTTNGLDRIDPITFEIEHFDFDPPNGQSAIGYIYAVFQDSEEFVWLSTDVALFKLDLNSGSSRHIPVRKDSTGVPSFLISYNGFTDTEQGIWFHTTDGMTFYDYTTKLFQHRYYNPLAKDIFNIKKKVPYGQSDLEMDDSGRIWFINDLRQLISYHPETNTLDSIPWPVPEEAWPCCMSVEVDPAGNIWTGARHGGVLLYHKDSKTFTHLRAGDVNSLIHSDYIYAIERGSDGRMFVSHDNGLDIIDLYNTPIREFNISGSADFVILKHQSGDITFDESTRQLYIPLYYYGYVTFDPQTGTFHAFTKKNFPAVASVITSAGQPLIAAKGDLFSFQSPDDEIVLTYGTLPEEVVAAGGQVIWFYREGPDAFYVKKNNGKLIHWSHEGMEVFDCAGFKPNVCISRDSQSLYFLNWNLDLICRHLHDKTLDTIPLQAMLSEVDFSFTLPRHLADDGQSIWISGQNGVLRYHKDGRLSTYTMDDGLSHNFNFAMVCEPDGGVWVGNLGGIDKYDSTADRFVSVHRTNRSTYMDAFGHAVCTGDGKLFFHMGNKVFIIDPTDQRIARKEHMQIRLHEVIVNGRHIDWRNSDALQRLKAYENRITFTYDVTDFIPPQLVTFSYRLNGREWVNNGRRTEVHLDGMASGTYTFEVRPEPAGSEVTDRVLNITFAIAPPFWRTWWFMAAIAGMACAIIIYFLRRSARRVRERHQIEMQMAELKSTALRAQMNPHFIFNCLNAIQECVVTGQIDAAYTYLSKFSRLLRLVLEHSDLTEIPLHQEIEMLELYTSLEKLRFRQDVDFRLIIDDELEPEELHIPPMLIQPHIENALVHGLRNQAGPKTLHVRIAEDERDYLRVDIEDNGIGIRKSMASRSLQRSGHRHASRGLAISRQRISLLKDRYPRTEMTTIDLSDVNKDQTGTRVSVILPVLTKTT